MDVNRKTRVMNVMANDEMRDILAWYGLPLDNRNFFRATLEDFCDAHDVDVDDVLIELTVAEVDSDDDWADEYTALWAEPS